MATNRRFKTPLDPIWDVDDGETLIWRGPATVTGQKAPRDTSIILSTDPDLGLQYRQEEDPEEDLKLFFDPERDDVRLTIPELTTSCAVVAPSTSGGHITRLTWGDPDRVHALRLHIPNFPFTLLPEPLEADGAWWRGTVTATGGPWTIRLDTHRSGDDRAKALRNGRRISITHIGEVTRHDGSPFDADELQSILHCVQVMLSFCRSAWVAPLLPVGLDSSRQPVWWEAADRHLSHGLGRGITWLDRHDGHGLAQACEHWMARWQDPFWREVLHRAVVFHCEANRQGYGAPSFLETKLTAAQAGLELLAWALLKEDRPRTDVEQWRNGGPRAAEQNLRGLLEWAGIPLVVPEQLPALVELAVQQGLTDAVPIVPQLRNQAVHPRRRDGRFGAGSDVILQGWRLACWYLELVVLRVLGYGGEVSVARLGSGTWVGERQPLPWNRGRPESKH